MLLTETQQKIILTMTINRDVANDVAGRPQKINRPHAYPILSNGDMRIAQKEEPVQLVGIIMNM